MRDPVTVSLGDTEGSVGACLVQGYLNVKSALLSRLDGKRR